MTPNTHPSQSTTLYEAKNKAIKFIQMNQNIDGSFITCPSIFASTIILRCLESLKNFEVTKNIREKGVYFLMNKKSENWSWNYWTKDSKCPDDLDDTFSALSAINLYDENLITGEALFHISNILIACEISTGGPYNTWLLPNNHKQDKNWLDIDIVVNSNVAYFLKLKGVKMPRLIEYTEKIIKDAEIKGQYGSKYYDDLTILYFVSRWYTGTLKSVIRDQVFKLRDPKIDWGNNLRNALAISILISTDAPHEIFDNTLKNLIETIAPFKPYPFYIESIKTGQPNYAKSSTLTAAICAEALSLFEQKYINNNSDASVIIRKDIHENAILEIKTFIDQFPQKTKAQIYKIFQKIENDQQITTISYNFSKKYPEMKKVSSQLGIANAYGWLAYTIYDDILDMENERNDLLPIANICFMKVLEIYETINNGNVKSLSKELILKMEKANVFEKEFFNLNLTEPINLSNIPIYKDYDILAEKSMPHALGPISLFLLKEKDPSILINFFKHYLIAKQLNDDAHDWFDDLKKGFVNSVGSLVLLDYFSRHQGESIIYISNKRSEELLHTFHHKILDNVSTRVIEEIEKARQILGKIKPIWDKNYLEKILKPLEQSANKAISERNLISDFISTYKKI